MPLPASAVSSPSSKEIGQSFALLRSSELITISDVSKYLAKLTTCIVFSLTFPHELPTNLMLVLIIICIHVIYKDQ